MSIFIPHKSADIFEKSVILLFAGWNPFHFGNVHYYGQLLALRVFD